jgi:diguanylate cyclase (GGDEF)-like protein
MDPRTVIVILAIHLICSGGLYWLIGRSMPPRSGVNHWSAGAVLFGVAYLGRLASAPQQAWPVALVFDAAMVFAGLMFVSGLRQFVGREPGRWPLALGVLLLYALVFALAVWRWEQVGRHLLLNVALGLIYAVLAAEALWARGRQGAALRPPLSLLALVMGVLAALTLARGLSVPSLGIAQLFTGLFAQVFYAYASLAAVLLGLNLLWLVFVRLNGQLVELASRDPLTRLLNRNGLDEVVARHFAARETKPVTLLQIDIDHFKRINDSIGHAAGDLVLREVAKALAASVRASDFIARTGGEEFLVGCVAADDGVARALAQRLLASVRQLDIRVQGVRMPVHCTVSIGISHRCAGKADWERCWAEADRALYAAKAAGRDRIVAAAALHRDVR